ncbi:Nif11-like leader peptide family RiPP precursor [Synechococcus sp. A18-25c]
MVTEAGFSISANDLKKAQSEISDEELESAAAGNDAQRDRWCWFGDSMCQ